MRPLSQTTRVSGLAVLLVPVLLAPRAARAEAAAGAGAIDHVVVFADRARVTRSRSVPCDKGVARAVFERLPASLDVRTLRGEVREQAEVVGLGGDLVNEEQVADPRARALEAQREKVRTEIRTNEATRAAIAGELETVGTYGGVFSATVTEEMRSPSPNTPAWTKVLESLRTRRAALKEQDRKLNVALRGLRREDNRLGRQQQQLAGAGGNAGVRTTRTATVTVDCRTLAQVTASLSYVVPGATWQPEYDLDFSPRARGKTGAGAVRFTVGAVVRQATGEDWTNARLMLSTARPRLGSEAPEPAPMLVSGYEQRRDKVLVQSQERRDQLNKGGSAGTAGPTAAGLDDKGNAFVLTLPHRVSVVADGRPIWAPVDVIESTGTTKLVATPKLDPRVYQVVSLKNPAAYALLDGRVRAYRAGSYVGDARLRYRGVGEPLEVSLGLDDELKIERKTVEEKDKGPAFLGSTKRIVRAYQLVLTNRAGNSETVELRENVPVSKIDDVKVEIIGPLTTPGYQWDAARGFITWSVTLASGKQQDVRLGYAIALPESWQVN